jgi:FlaA1/EpsC-like NDP-sugar epimerase
MHKLIRKLTKLRNRHFLCLDVLFLLITPSLALVVRLDGWQDLGLYWSGLAAGTLLFLASKLSMLFLSGFYQHCWRYAGIDELARSGQTIALATVLQTLLFHSLSYLPNSPLAHLPRTLPILDGVLSFLLIGGLRGCIPLLEHAKQPARPYFLNYRTLIVGAGSAGIALVKEMQRNPRLGFRPVAFIDDAPDKRNLQIRGLSVAGDRHKIAELIRPLRIRKIIIAIPSAPGTVIREIAEICQRTGIPTSTLPGIQELLSDRVRVESLRDIQIEDLLRREPVHTDTHQVSALLRGKTILVTGAGGSIGSELCRQILPCYPAEIVLLGKGENSVFIAQQELEQLVKTLDKQGDSATSLPKISSCIADIRSPQRLASLFEQFKPQVVFHAAAHKHVPLMELNVPEAITSNVLGTKNLLEMALRYSVSNFVMISTDKAVNPTSVMGASKRVAEMLVMQAAKKERKPFVVVRLGNVLGSRGSVVPTFKQQIAAGGPVTITHPDICRYFMTIPEAVQLVLQASILGHGGEILMLDMGKPVKIIDLAQQLIEFSCHQSSQAIPIVFTGLRPGEKLFEELFIPGESYQRTQHEKIMVVRNASSKIPTHLDLAVDRLETAAAENNSHLIRSLLAQLVVEYAPNDVNIIAHDAGNDASLVKSGVSVLDQSPRDINAVELIQTSTQFHRPAITAHSSGSGK